MFGPLYQNLGPLTMPRTSALPFSPLFWLDSLAGVEAVGGGAAGLGVGVAAWRDQSGGANDVLQATVANQPTVAAAVGGSGRNGVRFDGTNDNLIQSRTVALTADEYTVAAWVTAEVVSGTRYFLSNGANQLIGINGNKLFCQSSNTVTTQQITGVAVLAVNTLYHVVLTRTTSQLQAWLNGALDVSAATSAPTTNYSGNLNIGVGSRSNNSAYFQGSIYRAAIWNRALTSAEIGQLYATGLT